MVCSQAAGKPFDSRLVLADDGVAGYRSPHLVQLPGLGVYTSPRLSG